VAGPVAALALNTDVGAAYELGFRLTADRYTLAAKDPMDSRVDLDASELKPCHRQAFPSSPSPGQKTSLPVRN
jgi:hypothetical protein